MNKLTFTKKSILFSLWDESSTKWIQRDITETDLPITWYLPYEVFVDEGVTLRDVIQLLTPYTQSLNFVFVSYLKGLLFEEVLDSLQTSEVRTTSIKADAICMLWVGQIKPLDDEDDSIDMYPTLMALEMGEDEDGEEDEFHSIYELSVNQLLDKQLVLDDFLEFYDESQPEETTFSGVTNWSFFDFTRCILSELVMHCFTNGLFPTSDAHINPMTSTELFEHLDQLDIFFKPKPEGTK
jgi:hypothetical protein